MAEELKIVIGAETKGAEDGVKRVTKSLATLKPATNGATLALSNLGRIVQDAPFGFIGIANNIEPAIQALTNMQGGVKSLVGALAGPAGMLFAVSAVSSLVQSLTLKYGGMGAALVALTGPTDALTTATRDMNKEFGEAQGKAAGEISRLKSLVSIASDETKSRSERNEALKVLNKEYDEFLPKLTTENINTDKVRESIDKLTVSILRNAKIKGLQDLISKESAKQAEILSGNLADNLKWYDFLTQGVKGLGTTTGGYLALAEKGLERQGEALQKSNDRIKIFEDTLKRLLGEEALAGTLFGDMKESTKKIKENVEAVRHARLLDPKELETAQKISDIINGIRTPKKAAFEGNAPTTIPDLPIDPTAFTKPLSDLEKKLDEFNEKFKKQLSDLRAVFVEGFAEMVGGIAGGAGFKAALGQFLGLIGGALQSIGRSAVEAGIEMLALKKALTGLFTNPAALIAVGAAAIAVGAAIKARIPKFAEGGIVTKPTLGLFGEAGPEAVIPLNKFDQLGGGMPAMIELRLKGRDAVGLIDMNRRSLNRIT